jgi:transposase
MSAEWQPEVISIQPPNPQKVIHRMDLLKRKPYKRMTPEEVQAAARAHAEGLPVATLASQFQVSERQLHRILKNQANPADLPPDVPAKPRHIPAYIQEFHSAWLYEELILDSRVTLDYLAEGLKGYFNLDVSTSTVWRHIRGGSLEAHGFPGFTKEGDVPLED